VHATLTTKNAHAPSQARLCDGAATSLPWKPLRIMLNLENFYPLLGKQKTLN